jgi:hypothetical protein
LPAMLRVRPLREIRKFPFSVSRWRARIREFNKTT